MGRVALQQSLDFSLQSGSRHDETQYDVKRPTLFPIPGAKATHETLFVLINLWA